MKAEGLPDAIAVRGSFTQLGIPALIDVAQRMAGGDVQIVAPDDIPLPHYKNVSFAFATPGATDAQLGLVESGFKLNGEVWFLGRELGEADVSAGPSGIKMDAEVNPIDLKVLNLDKNRMDFYLGFAGLPKLEIDSRIKFLGAEQDVTVRFENGAGLMAIEEKIGGGIWDSTITLGFDVVSASGSAPDVFVGGEVKSDFFAWLRNQAPKKAREFFDELHGDFEKAKGKIDQAEAKVRGLDGKIQARKEVVQRERANADSALRHAEDRVRSVKHDVDHAHGEYEHHKHRCHWYSAWHCAEEAWWWGRYEIENAAYRVAEGVLHAAQSAVDHLPSELLDPELLALEASKETAMAELELAKAAIDDVEKAEGWLAHGLEDLLKRIGDTNALVIKEIYFEGDLVGVENGEPLILVMDLEVFGEDLGTQWFAFKLNDPVFNAQQLEFIPLKMVSRLFAKHLPSSLKKLSGPILRSIDAQARAATRRARDELKDVPDLDLPPELQEQLQEARIEGGHGRAGARRYAALGSAQVMNDSAPAWLVLTQSEATPASTAGQQPASGPDAAARSEIEQRLRDYRERRRNLLSHMLKRNQSFGQSLVDFEQAQLKERRESGNDLFVTYTDTTVRPGVAFTQRLLVARHARLCLGQNAAGKITFHPCNENPGGLLWSTKRVLVDRAGRVISWDEKFAKTFPGRVYWQLVHNGACLTTPFHLASRDADAHKAHGERLAAISRKPPKNADAHLKLAPCRASGDGQLWKTVKITHGRDRLHGFKLQERQSGFCLRPDSVKAKAKKPQDQVLAVFYPCTGIAHATFELVVPNDDTPVWYDHNGVIKSDRGACLSVPHDPAANDPQRGSVVYLEDCQNDEYDRWDYVVDYDKTVKIVNDFTGHCLYPYNSEEGKIQGARAGQLVQRPCDARHGQNWKLRIIPKQSWFQLEALNKERKPTGRCMIPAEAKAGRSKVAVFVRNCRPATRGRWEFGHWQGTYAWSEWTPGDAGDLTTTYWVSKDDRADESPNGVCRVISGDHSGNGAYDIHPGTWHGAAEVCKYAVGRKLLSIEPGASTEPDLVVEVLTGLDIGVPGASAEWMNSAGGLPVDHHGQHLTPPAPRYAPFLVGGTHSEPAFYLCRVRAANDNSWHYGHQTASKPCQTDATGATPGPAQVLVFKRAKH